LRFGANYVPSAGWFYSWLDFDADTVRRDFADLAELGLDHVRIFPVWPWLQPNRGLVRASALNDVLTTIDCAAEFGLDVAVDLIQGHMSSFDFLPSWVLTWHQASIFTDRTVREGLAHYVEVLSGAVAGRRNVFALTLGNEVNNLWPANPTTRQQSHDWAAELLDTARAAAPDLLCLHSLYDDAWYAADHPFAQGDAATLGDLTTVHSWVFNGVSRLDGPLGPATVSHADYLVELAAAAATAPRRPVWLQEVGAPRPDIPAALAADFTRTTIEQVWHNPALFGITWWCSHDIDRSLLDFPDREYDLGLFTVDHQRKPAAEAIAELITRRGTATPDATRPGLVCPVDLGDPAARDALAPGSAFHRAWVTRRAHGPVAIVPAARAANAEYRAARGISSLLEGTADLDDADRDALEAR
jgi:endo-1,4-beta-mannosidase